MTEGSGGTVGDEAATKLLHVDGIEGPAARLRLTPEGVELTFLAERHPGFLTWLTSRAASHVYCLMREHEREAVVDEMVTESTMAASEE